MLFVVIFFCIFYFEKVMMAAVQSCAFDGSPRGRRAGAALVLE